jgi:DNA polymerase III gamma/tau subunit
MKSHLECPDQDFYEYNSANVRGIDTIRDIGSGCQYAAFSGGIKIYLLDECHKITPDGQAALLKLLEDTPSHVFFILCTTDPEKLITTIKTRCSRFEVSALPRHSQMKLLRDVCGKEGVEIDSPILIKIADSCNGSPRQALVMLDQIIDIVDPDIAMQAIIDCTVDDVKVLDLCRALVGGRATWAEVSTILKGLTGEPESIRYAVLGYLNSVLLNRGDDRTAKTITYFCESYMYVGKAGLSLSCYMAVTQ